MRNANNRQPMNNRPRMEMQTDKNMECKRRQQPDKKSLLNEINECSFAVNDMLLYLDTHPCDEAALSYFMEHKNRRVAALKEYAKYYGPLTIDTADDEASESFLWAMGRRRLLICGIMKKDCNIRLISKTRMEESPRSS